MHLKCKDWKRFWRKKQLQKCPKDQVMAIFARSPKSRIFWKVKRGDQDKFFKNHLKSSHWLKGPKALWRKWQYPLISMHINCKNWKRFWRKKQLQKRRNDQVMAILERSPKARIFWKSAKVGPGEIFQKSAKRMPSLKRPKSSLAQMAFYSN